MTLYLAQHTSGYCFTHDSSEREPFGYTVTLCGWEVLMPLALDTYDEARVAELIEDLEMCADCVRVASVEKGDPS